MEREKVMEILGQQLELLAEKSKEVHTTEEVILLSNAMTKIAEPLMVIDPLGRH